MYREVTEYFRDGIDEFFERGIIIIITNFVSDFSHSESAGNLRLSHSTDCVEQVDNTSLLFMKLEV
jgi:hypothetical protein